MIRRFATIAVVCGVCGLAGCGTDTTARLELYDQAVRRLEQASEQIDSRLAAIDAFLAQAQIALADPNLGDVAGEILAGVQAAIAKRDEALEVKQKVDTALAQIRVQIDQLKAAGSIDVSDEIGLVGSGLAAAGQASGGKTGAWLVAIGGLVAAAGGVIRGNRAAGSARHVAEKVIASVDTLLNSSLVTDAEQAKKLLAKGQGTTIATAVKTIKDG